MSTWSMRAVTDDCNTTRVNAAIVGVYWKKFRAVAQKKHRKWSTERVQNVCTKCSVVPLKAAVLVLNPRQGSRPQMGSRGKTHCLQRYNRCWSVLQSGSSLTPAASCVPQLAAATRSRARVSFFSSKLSSASCLLLRQVIKLDSSLDFVLN